MAPDRRLTYGTADSQFGDLRLPDTSKPCSVVIVIHGGFWKNLYGLDYMRHLCQVLAEAGIATWSLEYHRTSKDNVGWPRTFEDVAAGADYLRQIANRLPLDLTRVIAVGHSAGGHLALWLAARHRVPKESGLPVTDPIHLRGVVSLAGVTDLRRGWAEKLSDAGDAVERLMGGSPEEFRERYAWASPIELLPLSVRQILLHGTKDPYVPFDYSRAYCAAARAAGDDVSLIELEDAGHFEAVNPRSNHFSVVRTAINELLQL